MKEEIRREALLARKEILNKEEKSHKICETIRNHPKFIESKSIAFYKALKNEVSLEEVIDYALMLGKKVSVPKVEDNHLVFYEITDQEDYILSPFHVPEPVGDDSKRIEEFDLIFVPGVVFDKKLHRMGFGKGYYDRFLKDKNVYKIGVCFQEQIRESIPVNEEDISMDEIVTN